MWSVTRLVGLVYSHRGRELGFIIKLNYSHLSDSLQLLLGVDLPNKHSHQTEFPLEMKDQELQLYTK